MGRVYVHRELNVRPMVTVARESDDKEADPQTPRFRVVSKKANEIPLLPFKRLE